MKLTTGLPQSQSSPFSTKPFPHTGGSKNCGRQVMRTIIYTSTVRTHLRTAEICCVPSWVCWTGRLLHRCSGSYNTPPRYSQRTSWAGSNCVFRNKFPTKKQINISYVSYMMSCYSRCGHFQSVVSSLDTNVILSGLIWGFPYLQIPGDPDYNMEADRV